VENTEFLVVGLGNPGEKYQHSRHNIGFLLYDQLVEVWQCSKPKEKWQGRYITQRVCGKKVHFVKPITYMNRSGDSVRHYFSFHKVPVEHLLVIHDDLDMDPGRVKLVRGGGHGGHKGIKSIVDCIGTRDFYRLKFGIGRPGKGGVHPGFPVENFVLGALSDEELQMLALRQPDIIRGVEYFFSSDPQRAMGVLNSLK
jgi:PTH1 family peptidyl-tRNA hydrolase